ncbi:MAG: hypothetical protein AAGF96_07915 [Bacteroidota bacterium]
MNNLLTSAILVFLYGILAIVASAGMPEQVLEDPTERESSMEKSKEEVFISEIADNGPQR